MPDSFRVWLDDADQDAHDGFWAHRGDVLPQLNEVIFVENLLEPGDVTNARVTSVTPGGDPQIYATQID